MPKPPAAFSPLITDQIEFPLADQIGSRSITNCAPGAPDNIADEKNAHAVNARENR
jgi:hypothetical protein